MARWCWSSKLLGRHSAQLIATKQLPRLPLCLRIRYGCGALLSAVHDEAISDVSEAEIRTGSE
jgi:hypothetical protein